MPAMPSNVEIRGQSGPPVLLLPGGAETVLGFFPGLVEGLVSSPGCRVILHDRPGTGASPGSNLLANAADHLHQTLTELGLGPVVLVGQSLGGAVALLLAAKYPADVAGIALLDPTPINDVRGCKQLESAMKLTKRLIKIGFLHRMMQAQLLKGMRKSMRGKTLRPECSAAIDKIGNLDLGQLADACEGIGQVAKDFRAEAVPRVPTVFVTADRKPNHAIHRSHAQLAAALGVSLIQWPNAAHNLQLDHPDETLEVVRSLLARTMAPAR